MWIPHPSQLFEGASFSPSVLYLVIPPILAQRCSSDKHDSSTLKEILQRVDTSGEGGTQSCVAIYSHGSAQSQDLTSKSRYFINGRRLQPTPRVLHSSRCLQNATAFILSVTPSRRRTVHRQRLLWLWSMSWSVLASVYQGNLNCFHTTTVYSKHRTVLFHKRRPE